MKLKSSKKYIIRHKKMAFGGEPDEEVLAVHTFYDKNGNIIKELKIDDDEGTNEKIIYEYNDSGKLIRNEHFMESDGISEHFIYERDDKNRITCEQKFYGDDPGEKVVYHYDNSEDPIKIERFDSDGDHECTEIITYNDQMLLIEHCKLNSDNITLEKTVITYNEHKQPVQKIAFSGADQTEKTVDIIYNEFGDITKLTESNANGKLISDVRSVYNEKRLLIERRIRDFQSRIVKFEYDEFDNCVCEEIFDEHGNLSMKLTYEFDEANQLTGETAYYLNNSGAGQPSNSQSRYEHEYWEE